MSAAPAGSITQEALLAFLYREARLLDDREWDEWLTCYAPEAEFWMPAWDDNDRLVEDPQQHISLIYYPTRDGLEDRVFRIKTERSSASTPEPRTGHNITNVERIAERDGEIDIRFNWLTMSHRLKGTHSFFGTSFYTLDVRQSQPLITKKKVILKDDYIRQVIDIYHI